MEPGEHPRSLRGTLGRLSPGRKRDATAEMTFAATPDRVWGLVSDVERIGEWWPRAISGLILDGEEVGREQVVTLDWGRKRGIVRQKVTEWEPGRRYGWRIVSERFGEDELPRILDSHVTIEIVPQGALAHVRIRALYSPVQPKGAIALRQMSKLARSTFRDALRRAEAALVPK